MNCSRRLLLPYNSNCRQNTALYMLLDVFPSAGWPLHKHLFNACVVCVYVLGWIKVGEWWSGSGELFPCHLRPPHATHPHTHTHTPSDNCHTTPHTYTHTPDTHRFSSHLLFPPAFCRVFCSPFFHHPSLTPHHTPPSLLISMGCGSSTHDPASPPPNIQQHQHNTNNKHDPRPSARDHHGRSNKGGKGGGGLTDERYDMLKVLGEGASCKVVSAKDKKTGVSTTHTLSAGVITICCLLTALFFRVCRNYTP